MEEETDVIFNFVPPEWFGSNVEWFFNVTGLLIPESRLGSTLGILAVMLGLFMVTGLYLRQRKESGTLGVISYILEFLGTALAVGFAFTNAYVLPSLSESMQAELLTGITERHSW